MPSEKTFGEFLAAVKESAEKERIPDAIRFIEDLERIYLPEKWEEAKGRPFCEELFWHFAIVLAACYKKEISGILTFHRLIIRLENGYKFLSGLYAIAEEFGIERWKIEIYEPVPNIP